MEKVILIRYGEIFLKGKNRRSFEDMLLRNVLDALRGMDFKYERSQSRLYIVQFSEYDYEEIIFKLTKVFGIYSMSLAYKIPTDLDVINQTALSVADGCETFRVTVRRADKTIPHTSQELSAMIGGFILSQRESLKVDLHNPQKTVTVDIRENKTTYVFFETVKGLEGMPVGSAGRGLLLLSGGIDSPVAGYRMAKRGMKIHGLHFHSYPFTSPQAKDKVVELAKKVSLYSGSFKLFVVSFTEIQQAIHEFCREDFMITVMRMIMVKIAERIAKNNGCGAVITGESLGQVASQTLESITVTNSQIEDLPIFRPLIALDKSEIIETAKQIDTFETSILPFEDCCTVFLPKNPIIKPSLKNALIELNKIKDLNKMIDECIATIEVVKI